MAKGTLVSEYQWVAWLYTFGGSNPPLPKASSSLVLLLSVDCQWQSTNDHGVFHIFLMVTNPVVGSPPLCVALVAVVVGASAANIS